MTLASGTRLGPYQIVAPLGAGGMGEVYRAHDARLKRDVAIKVLPQLFSTDEERLARFAREAQVLAALNHPNIAGIYGIEEAGDVRALVMELVEGVTLAQRLTQGALPLDEAIPIARQIADALEAAHEKGIIHRDLKPANIAFTAEGQVKVLDFGLAKALDPEAGSDPSHSPTLTMRATQAGVILGTAAYMSPEQARGRAVDKRTDVWAFGCVLYEMLTGKRTFAGEEISDLLAFVITKDPDWTALPASTPASVRRLLRRCLEKDRRRRLADIADARLEIEEAPAEPVRAAAPAASSRRGAWRRWMPWSIATATVLVVAVVLWSPLRKSPDPSAAARLMVALPRGDHLAGGWAMPAVAISPDGAKLVYVAAGKGTSQLFLRRMDGFEAAPIPGTEGGTGPFFSPDGEWVGFFAEGKLKKVALSGGAPYIVCNALNGRGATWTPDDTIIFTAGFASGLGLSRVPAAGGAPQQLTSPDSKKDEFGDRWPEVLPGGAAVLFTIWKGSGINFDQAGIGVLSLRTGERKMLLEGGSGPRYAPALEAEDKGYVVFARAGRLLAAPLDLAHLQITGPAVPVLDGLMMSARTGAPQYSLSRTGTLVYVPGSGQGAELSLVWVDRKGVAQPASEIKGAFDMPRLSPDGRQLAYSFLFRDVWIHDLARDAPTRLTFEDRLVGGPVWTPDGKRVVYGVLKDGAQNLFWKLANGTGGEQRLTSSPYTQFVSSLSPEGKWLVFEESRPDTGSDIWVLPMDSRKPRPLLQTPFVERGVRFSPDGRWLAYYSNESGPFQVYVQSFSTAEGSTRGKWQVSTDGGAEPIWAPSGKELFYRNGDKIMAVDVTTEPAFTHGRPRLLFEGQYELGPTFMNWDVAPDGQRFLMIKASETGAPTQVNVALNWFDELRARAGSGKAP